MVMKKQILPATGKERARERERESEREEGGKERKVIAGKPPSGRILGTQCVERRGENPHYYSVLHLTCTGKPIHENITHSCRQL